MDPFTATRRLLLSVPAQVRGVGMNVGLLPYQPDVWASDRWEGAYGQGRLEYFGGLEELGRYSMLVGYLGWLGGRPDVLDVGCGPGVLRTRIPDAILGSYTGVDPTATAIESARSAGLEGGNSRFVVGDTRSDDLDTYDVVVCNEVLYMVPDPRHLLEDVHRLLRPGGHLLTSIWRHPGDAVPWRLVDGAFERIDVVHVRNQRNDHGPRGWRVACHRRP